MTAQTVPKSCFSLAKHYVDHVDLRTMTHNDVLRSVRHLMKISDLKLIEIARLAECEICQADIIAYLKRDDEDDYRECPDAVMAHFFGTPAIEITARAETSILGIYSRA